MVSTVHYCPAVLSSGTVQQYCPVVLSSRLSTSTVQQYCPAVLSSSTVQRYCPAAGRAALAAKGARMTSDVVAATFLPQPALLADKKAAIRAAAINVSRRPSAAGRLWVVASLLTAGRHQTESRHCSNLELLRFAIFLLIKIAPQG